MKKNSFPSFLAPVFLSLLAGCGSRDSAWNAYPENGVAEGLSSSVALVDPTENRVLVLSVEADLSLTPKSLPILHGFTTATTTNDHARLLVLCRGDVPREKSTDDGPVLDVILDRTATSSPKLEHRYPLPSPLSKVAVDPKNHYAVVYAANADSTFLTNPNELSLVDLTKEPSTSPATNPLPITLRSFGGTPQSLLFTDELYVPGGARRLLTVLTDRDLSIVDLSEPALGDITVQLSTTGALLTPLGVAVTPGNQATGEAARMAVRIKDSTSVMLIDMLDPLPNSDAAHSFRPSPTMAYAGGVPSDVAFVKTDQGLRLAALVPSQQALTLIDPATGLSSNVELGGSYEHLSLVTNEVGATDLGSDVALLWSSTSSSIAFVALGSTIGKPYKSIERRDLGVPINQVIDIPKTDTSLDPMKVLVSTSGSTFFVLDLVQRTPTPVFASQSNTVLLPTTTGTRTWFYTNGSNQLAYLDFPTVSPTNITLDWTINGAFDLARSDGRRALVAVSTYGDFNVTVVDGETPKAETAHTYPAVLLGGLQ